MSLRLLAVAVIVAITACASAPSGRGRRPGEEYLAAIHVEGNTAIEEEALVRGLSLQRARQARRGIDEYQLGLDLTRIEAAYLRRGFLSVKVVPRVDRKGDAATLVFQVTEGPRATTAVELVGLPPEVPVEQARALIRIEDGAPFSYLAYDEAKAPLLALVENAGYAHVQLEASVLADRAKNRATLRFVFDAGPRVTFGAIEVVGATGVLARAIERRAAFKPGDPYSTKAVAESQQAVYGIGRFTSVRVDVNRDGLAAVVPVKITVVQAKRSELRAGVGVGIDTLNYQARMRLALSHKGWPTPLTTLGGEFRPAAVALRDDCSWYEVSSCDLNLRWRLLGTARQQDLFVRGLDGGVEGGIDYLQIEAYTMTGARAKLTLEAPLRARHLNAQIGWQVAGYRFTEFNDALDEQTKARIGVDRFERLGAFTQSFEIDYRDNPVNPRLGGYAKLELAEGTVAAGGAYDYIQLTPDVRGFLPLGRFVFAARARLGVIRGDVAPTERYYAGGASSQRGFAERRLAPLAKRDVDGTVRSVVIGGAASFETGAELRTLFEPGGYKLGVVAFVDGADVTELPGELQLGNLHWAVGLGFRPVYLPIGPIRIDIGYRLNRIGPNDPSPGERWNYHISVGEAF